MNPLFFFLRYVTIDFWIFGTLIKFNINLGMELSLLLHLTHIFHYKMNEISMYRPLRNAKYY